MRWGVTVVAGVALCLSSVQCVRSDIQDCGKFQCPAGTYCQLDSGSCVSDTCGDGVVNGLGEECDGGDFSVSCEDEGFYAVAIDEELACNSSCKLDSTVCEGKCGDGIVNGPETCDRQEISTTCFQEGYDRGYVTCEESCTPNLADCGEIGWKQIRMPSAGDLNDVWIDSTNQMAYAVGQGFFQFDGTAWVLLANPGEELDSLSGVSEKEIYAVGSSDGVWRFDGENWETLKEPTIPSSLQYNAVWASGPNDVWIVGTEGTIVRYQDSEFVTQDVSVPGSVELNDIWGCLLYTSPSPRDATLSRMPSSA